MWTWKLGFVTVKGQTGGVCKHQPAYPEEFLLELPQELNMTPAARHGVNYKASITFNFALLYYYCSWRSITITWSTITITITFVHDIIF